MHSTLNSPDSISLTLPLPLPPILYRQSSCRPSRRPSCCVPTLPLGERNEKKKKRKSRTGKRRSSKRSRRDEEDVSDTGSDDDSNDEAWACEELQLEA